MYTRTSPYIARIKERGLLSKEGSSKKTYHISLEINAKEISFTPGDSLAVIPTNDPKLVDQIIEKLQIDPSTEVLDKKTKQPVSFREFLLTKANLQKCSFHKILPAAKKEAPLLEWVKEASLSPSDIAQTLLPLMPRFYSIANSAKVFGGEIHLLVAFVEYAVDGKTQYGVGSHFLCERAEIYKTPIPVYVQKSNHFTLPEDPSAPIILIGPGTGIAPYRAFLQERLALRHPGKNWIFFGERNRKTDFYYERYFLDLETQGKIRLSTAFSRDGKEKFYVQHRLFEERKSIWSWIKEGALIYVCGDAKNMAKDVDLTLEKIVHEEERLSEEDARLFLKQMRKEKRYLLDVY